MALVLTFIVVAQSQWISPQSPSLPSPNSRMAVGTYENRIILLGGAAYDVPRHVDYDIDSFPDTISISDTVSFAEQWIVSRSPDGAVLPDEPIPYDYYSQYYTSVDDTIYIVDTEYILIYNMDTMRYTKQWQAIPGETYQSGGFPCLASTTQYLFVIGGYSSKGERLNEFKLLVLSSLEWWTDLYSLAAPRIDHACAADELTNKLYVIGGSSYYLSDPDTDAQAIERINIDNNIRFNRWEIIGNLPSATHSSLFGLRAVVYQQTVFIIGNDLFYIIDTNNDELSTSSSPGALPSYLQGIAPIIVQNVIYVFGGHDRSINVQTEDVDTWMYAVLPTAIYPTEKPTPKPTPITTAKPTPKPTDKPTTTAEPTTTTSTSKPTEQTPATAVPTSNPVEASGTQTEVPLAITTNIQTTYLPTQWISPSNPLLPSENMQMAIGTHENRIVLLGGAAYNVPRVVTYDIDSFPDTISISDTVSFAEQFIFARSPDGAVLPDEPIPYDYSQYYTSINETIYIADTEYILTYNMDTMRYTKQWQAIPGETYQSDGLPCLASTAHYLFVIGGSNGEYLDEFKLLDLSSLEWSTDLPSLAVARKSHACAADELTNKLYAIGGNYLSYSGTPNSIERIHINNIQTNSWKIISLLPYNSRDDWGLRAIVYEQTIFIIGMELLYTIDTSNDEVSTTSSPGKLPYNIRFIAPIVVENAIYVFGGYDDSSEETLRTWMYALIPTDPPTDPPSVAITNIQTTYLPTQSPTQYRNLYFYCYYQEKKDAIFTFSTLKGYAEVMVDAVLEAIPLVLLSSIEYDELEENPLTKWKRGGINDFNICIVFGIELTDCIDYTGSYDADDNEYIAIGSFGIVAEEAIDEYEEKIMSVMTSNSFKTEFSGIMNEKLSDLNKRRLLEYNNFVAIRIEIVDPSDITISIDDPKKGGGNNAIRYGIVAVCVVFVVIIVILICLKRKRHMKFEKDLKEPILTGNSMEMGEAIRQESREGGHDNEPGIAGDQDAIDEINTYETHQ